MRFYIGEILSDVTQFSSPFRSTIVHKTPALGWVDPFKMLTKRLKTDTKYSINNFMEVSNVL